MQYTNRPFIKPTFQFRTRQQNDKDVAWSSWPRKVQIQVRVATYTNANEIILTANKGCTREFLYNYIKALSCICIEIPFNIILIKFWYINKYTYPVSVEVNWHKWWWDGEVINKWIEFQHEPKLIRSSNELKFNLSINIGHNFLIISLSTYSYKEIDHEK